MGQKDRIILTDCDGVLVNWIDGYTHYMRDQGFKEIPGTEGEYMISKRFDCTQEETHKHVTEYNQSGYLKSLAPMNRSVEFVKKLHEKHGFRFIVVTSVSSHPDAKKYRTENLHNLFGDIFIEINCLDIGTSKYDVLRRWVDCKYFWIEDHYAQAVAGSAAGLRPILVNDPTNIEYQSIFPRVDGWEEIYNIICEDYGLEK